MELGRVNVAIRQSEQQAVADWVENRPPTPGVFVTHSIQYVMLALDPAANTAAWDAAIAGMPRRRQRTESEDIAEDLDWETPAAKRPRQKRRTLTYEEQMKAADLTEQWRVAIAAMGAPVCILPCV